MFKEVRFSNFKSYSGAHNIELAPLTLIYGENSVGKSALLQLLLLMKQSLKPDLDRAANFECLQFNGTEVDLATFRSVVHGHDARRELHLGLTYSTLPEDERASYSTESFDVMFAMEDDKPLVKQVIYSIPELPDLDGYFKHKGFRNDLPIYQFSSEVKSHQEIATNLLRGAPKDLNLLPEKLLEKMSEVDYRLRGFLPFPASPSTIRRGDDRVFDFQADELDDYYKALLQWDSLYRSRWWSSAMALSRIHHIGGLRQIPNRINFDQPLRAVTVGSKGEHLVDVLMSRPKILGKVNKWLQILGVPYSVETATLDRDDHPQVGKATALVLTDQRSGTKVSAQDVGIGVSQILPIVVGCVGMGRSRVLFLEQPELHLHPRLQTELADLFLEVVNNVTNSQLIIETHSEHIMLRVKKRIREGKLDASLVKVLYIGDTNGTEISEIRLDNNGNFMDDWPKGFFAERIDEIL